MNHLFLSSPNVAKKGFLYYQENAACDTWVKRWFVVRRPYIYIYTDSSEMNEQGIINVSAVRIDYNEALEQMIEVSTFAYLFPPFLALCINFFFFFLSNNSGPMYLHYIPTTMPTHCKLQQEMIWLAGYRQLIKSSQLSNLVNAHLEIKVFEFLKFGLSGNKSQSKSSDNAF
jgi:hypothetical protein